MGVEKKSLLEKAEGVKQTAKKVVSKSKNSKIKETSSTEVTYDEDSILHLEGLEHIRLRPGMYIGSLGDGSNENDGIYILFKEGNNVFVFFDDSYSFNFIL